MLEASQEVENQLLEIQYDTNIMLQGRIEELEKMAKAHEKKVSGTRKKTTTKKK